LPRKALNHRFESQSDQPDTLTCLAYHKSAHCCRRGDTGQLLRDLVRLGAQCSLPIYSALYPSPSLFPFPQVQYVSEVTYLLEYTSVMTVVYYLESHCTGPRFLGESLVRLHRHNFCFHHWFIQYPFFSLRSSACQRLEEEVHVGELRCLGSQ